MSKALFFSIMLLFVLAQISTAQPEGRSFDPAIMAARQTERMAESLDLTEAQQDSVLAINTEFAKRMASARKMTRGNREAMREVMGPIREEYREALSKVLSSEQLAQWEEAQQKRQLNRRRNR